MSDKKYEHLFFDLDHTLWDFKTNSRLTLNELFEVHNLKSYGIADFETFLAHYEVVNEAMWKAYREGTLEKHDLRNRRFERVLKEWDVTNLELSKTLTEQYLKLSPTKPNLMPNAIETLNYLQESYPIHLITNGFIEVQATKLNSSGLVGYFKHIITSEEIGVLKPHPLVFETALQKTGADAHSSLYIGDHFESDVLGSSNAGWDQVFFNPENQAIDHHNHVPTFHIQDLKELMDFL
jgi:putative hydrolase of the HAD superfamily